LRGSRAGIKKGAAIDTAGAAPRDGAPEEMSASRAGEAVALARGPSDGRHRIPRVGDQVFVGSSAPHVEGKRRVREGPPANRSRPPARAFPRLPAPTPTVRQSNHAVRAHPMKISKV
jgi:hypothetical protein